MVVEVVLKKYFGQFLNSKVKKNSPSQPIAGAYTSFGLYTPGHY
jgi:hypothetical protein